MKNALKLLAGLSVAFLMLKAMAPDEDEQQVLEQADVIPEPEPEKKKTEEAAPVYEKPVEKKPSWTPVYEKPQAKPYHGTAFPNPFIGTWNWKSILVDDDFAEAEEMFGPTQTVVKEDGTVCNNGKQVGTWTINGDSLEITADPGDNTAAIDGSHLAVCGLDDGNMIMVVNVDGKGKIGSIFCTRK